MAKNTQESIAEILGVSRENVSDVIDRGKISTLGKITETFKPLLYNIWNTKKQDKINCPAPT